VTLSAEFTQLTEPWSSDADGGPTLRGRVLLRDGAPLIHFVHGNGFCGAVYWPFLREFRDEYSLFLHDVQGHGDSDNGDGFPGWRAVIERTAAVIRAHPATSARVPLIGMGHSFGASVTIFMAARYPELFRCLVLVDPVLFPPALKAAFAMIPGLNPVVRRSRVRTVHWPSRETAWNYLHQRGIFRGVSDDALACYIDHAMTHDDQGLRLKCPREIETAIFASMPPGLWQAIPRLRCPVFILHGQQTYPMMGRGARLAAQRNPHISVDSMPGNHVFMLQHPQEAHTLVRRFLKKHLS
jgi:pimeloyl-ACP methyl ester carboxylesterase